MEDEKTATSVRVGPGSTHSLRIGRWGEVIFRRENFPPSDPAPGWKGTCHGVMVGSGPYAYALLGEYVTGLTGKVMLIRGQRLPINSGQQNQLIEKLRKPLP